jgi:hypothetical protein
MDKEQALRIALAIKTWDSHALWGGDYVSSNSRTLNGQDFINLLTLTDILADKNDGDYETANQIVADIVSNSDTVTFSNGDTMPFVTLCWLIGTIIDVDREYQALSIADREASVRGYNTVIDAIENMKKINDDDAE